MKNATTTEKGKKVSFAANVDKCRRSLLFSSNEDLRDEELANHTATSEKQLLQLAP